MKINGNLKDYLNVGKVDTAKKYPPFIDHLFEKIDFHIDKKGRVLVLTLTKKSAEDVSNFLISKGYRAFYLHSEIDTIDRWEIIKKLKSGEIDVLVGINLLREGIDLPEVSFIAILDADKEGFLRSTTSLVQIIGRAARNPASEVVLYADAVTASILKAMWETYRRRKIQNKHNIDNNISPEIAVSNIKSLDVVKTDDKLEYKPHIITKGKVKRLKRMTKKEKEIVLKDMRNTLQEHIKKWEFEQAAIIRDQIKELEGD